MKLSLLCFLRTLAKIIWNWPLAKSPPFLYCFQQWLLFPGSFRLAPCLWKGHTQSSASLNCFFLGMPLCMLQLCLQQGPLHCLQHHFGGTSHHSKPAWHPTSLEPCAGARMYQPSLTEPSLLRRMLQLFTSRWIMRFEWRKSRPCKHWENRNRSVSRYSRLWKQMPFGVNYYPFQLRTKSNESFLLCY